MEIQSKQETANTFYHRKRICPVCGTEYQPKNTRRVYCSPLCRWRAFSMKKAGLLAGINTEIPVLQTQIQRKTNGEQTQNKESISDANAKQTETNANPTENADESLPLTENKRKTNAEQTQNGKGGSDPNGKQTQNQRKTNGEQTENGESIFDANAKLTEKEECFVSAIGDMVNERGLDEKFISPFEHWTSEQAEAISKVNKYLCCLLDCTLKLGGRRKIPATALKDLANGYAYLLNSETFIRSEHPYKEHTVHLHGYLSAYYKKYRSHSRLRLVVKRHDKVEIIAMLHEIGSSVSLHSFSELFHTPNTLGKYSNNTGEMQ